MTTPGGVPNLPAGALTLDTLAAKTQDMSGTAMKSRAVERFPSIFNNSTGLDPALDITPFGILTRIWAEVNSLVANADPADIQGPEDLPPLVLEFIEGLPVIGQFVELFEAILGTYDGTDTTLLGIQALFAPIRAVVSQFQQLINTLLGGGVTGQTSASGDPLAIFAGLLNQASQIPGDLWSLIFGPQATQQAQINAQANGGFTHDFASNGVTGWTNLVPTLALSSRGNYIQATTETVAYRSSGTTSDKFAAHMAVNPSMRGVARIGICSTSTGSNWAGLEVYRGFDGDALRLVTGSSPTLTVPLKSVDFIGTNRLPGVTNVDLKTDGVNKFTVLFNNQPVPALDWTDSGGIVDHGASNRNVLLTSNGYNRNQDGYYGPAITKVVSYAW